MNSKAQAKKAKEIIGNMSNLKTLYIKENRVKRHCMVSDKKNLKSYIR